MRMQSLLVLGVVSFASTVPLLSAAQDVKLSVNRSTQAVVAEIAERKGFYKEQGLEVKTYAEGSGAVSLQAIVGGSVDLAVGLHTRIIQGLAKNLPLCIVGMVQYGLTSQILVPPEDTTSKTMADLKGKRLAVQVGSGTYAAWLILLKELGLKESDFTVKHMKTNVIPAAFQSGGLDVGVAWEPYASIMVSKGLGRVLMDNDEWARQGKIVYPVFVYGNCEWIDSNQASVQKFMNAWIKAIKFIESDKKETVDLMEAAYKSWGVQIPRVDVEAGVYTRGYDKLTIDDESIQDSMNFAQIMYDTKKIKKVPDFRAALRPEYTKKALANN